MNPWQKLQGLVCGLCGNSLNAAVRATRLLSQSGNSGTSLSNSAMLTPLKKIGRTDIAPYGFRSTFRIGASERAAFPSETIEQALAHTIKNQVEAA